MGLLRYSCCSEMIGDAHSERCAGSPRYPLGGEREAAERHARQIGREIDRAQLERAHSEQRA